MDLYGELEALRQTPEAQEARAARREARAQHIYARLTEATRATEQPADELAGLLIEASGWNITPGGEIAEGEALGNMHPAAAAILVTRQVFAQLDLGDKLDLRYDGMRRASGTGAYGVEDGVIFLEATLHSISGPSHHIDIPVVVRQGRVLAPSILLHGGAPRIITQNTIDDIRGRGEFTMQTPDRKHMYAAPDKEAGLRRREVPRVHSGMYSANPSRSLIASAIQGQYLAQGQHLETPTGPYTPMNSSPEEIKQIVELAYQLQKEHGCRLEHAINEAVEQLFGSERKAFYNPDVTEILENGSLGKDVPGADGSHLDVAERPVDKMLAPGQKVRTSAVVKCHNRGGAEYTIPKGTDGLVVRDVDGAGRAYIVRFPELGYAVSVAAKSLK